MHENIATIWDVLHYVDEIVTDTGVDSSNFAGEVSKGLTGREL